MKYIDILIGNEEDAKIIFGYDFTDEYILEVDSYKYIMKKMTEEYKFEKIFFSLRESYSASRNGWSGICFDGRNFHLSKKYEIEIIDRLGAGDSFAAGVIYSEIEKYEVRKSLEFAVALSCLKHSIHYDFNLVSVDEVHNLFSSNGNTRIIR